MPKLSIIVPIYNREKYLPKCIESILNQTFKYFELLLIDDGSTDGSKNICDEYAKKDSRIRVFHKENGGEGSARNLGLDNVCCEWITFVDSDDWISNDTFSENMEIINTFPDIECLQYPISNRRKYLQNKYIQSNKCVRKYLVNNINNESCGRIFNVKIIGKNRFGAFKIGADLMFIIKIIPYLNNLYISNRGMYFYELNQSSAMNKSLKELVEKTVNLFNHLALLRNNVNKYILIGIFSNYLCVFPPKSSPKLIKYQIKNNYILKNMPFIDVIKSNLKLTRKIRYLLALIKIYI